MRPIEQMIFELQNMHFSAGILITFKWNVKQFGPTLQKFLDEARAEGRLEGKLEMQRSIAKNMRPRPEKVV